MCLTEAALSNACTEKIFKNRTLTLKNKPLELRETLCYTYSNRLNSIALCHFPSSSSLPCTPDKNPPADSSFQTSGNPRNCIHWKRDKVFAAVHILPCLFSSYRI